VVFITVQNLVGIDAVVSLIGTLSFNILRVRLENEYSRPPPSNWSFGDVTP